MNNKIKFQKWQKILCFVSCLSLTAITTLALTSCASINQELIDKSVSKGDMKNFAAGYDLNKMSKFALESNAAQTTYFDYNVNELLLDWIDFLSRKGDQITYKNSLEAQKKVIDEEYNNLVASSTKTNGADFEIKFQQDELDPNGGNEENWKKKKLLDWARTEFSNKVFEKNYLAVVDNTNVAIKAPTKAQILDAIDTATGSTKFAFSSTIIDEGNKDNYLDPIYANFQQFVYDKWVQIENPYIINMSLWKYGAPLTGIDSVYTAAPSSTPGADGTTSTSSGSYSFPYFSNDNATNDAWGTIDKFKNFLNGATTTNNYITDTTHGLIEIPKQYTEDSSTYILAKNGTIYNDLYIEFAAAATYLLYSGKTATGFPNIIDKNSDIQKATISTTATTADAITSNFVSNTNINNRDIKIANSLATQIINPNGEFKGLLGTNNTSDLFITDAFMTSETKLNKFMFLRNEAGVHAISIDGKTFIDKGTTIDAYKKNAANIVLYRSLMNKYIGDEFTVDVQTELSNFFKANLNWLILEYYQANSGDNTLKMFRPNSIWGDEKFAFLKLLNTYLFDVSKYHRPNDFQNKMYDAKVKFSSNYGILAKENGLAAPWIYTYKTNSTNFDLMDSVSFKNPFANSGSQSAYLAAIDAFVNSLNLSPLNSSFSGYKYSQYILVSDFYINQALTSYGADSDNIGNTIKVDILKNYLSTKINSNDLTFANDIFNGITSFASGNLESINSALVNSFFGSTFDSLTNKWLDYTTDTNDTISYSSLNSYKKQLWLNSKKVKTSAVSVDYLSLYTIMSTVDYLLKNNGTEFLNYLKTKMILGDETYIAWYSTQNTTLNTTKLDVSSLLNVTNTSLTKNINNTYKSSYYGATPVDTATITNNTNTNSRYTTNSYYNYVAGSIGFSGLQTSSSNSATPVINERMFTKQSENTSTTEGLLYTYGTNVSELNSIIDKYTLSSDVDNLARAIQKKIKTISINTVLTANTIDDKKTALKVITNSSSITATMFSPRTGYISSGALNSGTGTTIQDPNSLALLHGAKVIQLNNNDISSLANLELAIKKLFTTGSTIEVDTANVFYNLIIQAAADTSIQDQAISSIVTNDLKIDVYDIRLNNQLGPRWAKNWK
ncbi:MAG: hypothetical protein RSA40_02485 [Malacoplasma sp.]